MRPISAAAITGSLSTVVTNEQSAIAGPKLIWRKFQQLPAIRPYFKCSNLVARQLIVTAGIRKPADFGVLAVWPQACQASRR